MEKKLSLVYCFFLLLFSIADGHASALNPAQAVPDIPSSGEVTLEQCVAVALERNLLLQSSLNLQQAAGARVRIARNFAQPSLEIDSDLQPGFMDFRGSQESYLGFGWGLEFPGKRSLRGRIAEREQEQAGTQTELLKLDIIYQVKQAFYRLLLAQEILKYAEQDQELARDYLKKAEIKFEAGDVSRAEVLRARVEAARAETSVRAAANEVGLARMKLNFLMSRDKNESLTVRGEFKKAMPVSVLEELQEKARKTRPEVRRLDLALSQERLRKTLASFSYLPDFGFSLSRHRLEGIPRTWDLRLSLALPLFFWQPARGEIAEARFNLEALEHEKSYAANEVSLEVEEAYANALMARRQIELFEREILAQAEEAYNMFLFSYQEGEVGGIDLIEARRTLIEARKSYADSLYNFTVGLAALERAVGSDLEDVPHE